MRIFTEVDILLVVIKQLLLTKNTSQYKYIIIIKKCISFVEPIHSSFRYKNFKNIL